jgi:hypothetical protein
MPLSTVWEAAVKLNHGDQQDGRSGVAPVWVISHFVWVISRLENVRE